MMGHLLMWARAAAACFNDSRPNRVDWFIYYFFRWWWNPILVRLPDAPVDPGDRPRP